VTAADADEEGTGPGLNAFCNPVASFQSYAEVSLATTMLLPKRISSMEFASQLWTVEFQSPIVTSRNDHVEALVLPRISILGNPRAYYYQSNSSIFELTSRLEMVRMKTHA
jgi:hypothetical protein